MYNRHKLLDLINKILLIQYFSKRLLQLMFALFLNNSPYYSCKTIHAYHMQLYLMGLSLKIRVCRFYMRQLV
jgi:hypothetical protein